MRFRQNARSKFPIPCAKSTDFGVRRPLRRARSLERLLDTPARIFYKDESVAPQGSFKPNEAVAQAFYGREAGAKRLITFTGAGQ